MHNEELLKQLVRQMKIMNFWVTFFGVLALTALTISGFLLWQIVTFIGDTNRKIDELQTSARDSLNVQKQTCESDNAFSRWLAENTDAC